jgi:hypothetical protein
MALNIKCISEMVKCKKCPFLAPLYFQILAGTLYMDMMDGILTVVRACPETQLDYSN